MTFLIPIFNLLLNMDILFFDSRPSPVGLLSRLKPCLSFISSLQILDFFLTYCMGFLLSFLCGQG